MTHNFVEILHVTTEQRLQFIELRKREIDLAKAMVANPDYVETWQAWYSTAAEIDELTANCDSAEKEILNDLNKMLSVVYSGAITIEQLAALKTHLATTAAPG